MQPGRISKSNVVTYLKLASDVIVSAKPADAARTTERQLERALRGQSLTKPERLLVRELFHKVGKRCATPEAVEYTAAQLCARAAVVDVGNDGLSYDEFRGAPKALRRAGMVQRFEPMSSSEYRMFEKKFGV